MKISKKARKNIFWFLYECFKSYKLLFIGTVCFFTMWCSIEPYFISKSIGEIINILPYTTVENAKDVILPKFIMYIFFWGVGNLTFWIGGVFFKRFSSSIIKIRETMFNNIQNMPYDFFLSHDDGRLAKAIDVMNINLYFISEFICYTIPRMVILILIMASFFSINIWMGLTILAWSIIHFCITIYKFNNMKKISFLETEVHTKIMGFLVDNFKNQKIKEFFHLHHTSYNQFRELQQKDQKVCIESEGLKFNIKTMQGVLSMVFQGLFVNLFLFILWIKGIINVGMLVALMNMNGGAVHVVWHVSNRLPEFLYNIAKCQSVLNFLNDEKTMFRKHQTLKILNQQGNILIRNLSFKYQDEVIIDNLSLEIKAGTKILIMGYSGVGKTTFADILSGILQNYDGDIFFDNINIKSLDRDFLKEYVTFITNYGLFNDTIKNNILLNRSSGVEELKLLSKAVMLDQIDLNTEISSSHCMLSDGEKQRVLIARGLFNKKAKVMVGDEIFKGLDFPIKKRIINELEEFMKDKTVIIIDHSLVLAEKMDYIIFFGRNKKIYIDSYQNLIKNNEEYREFIKFDLSV